MWRCIQECPHAFWPTWLIVIDGVILRLIISTAFNLLIADCCLYRAKVMVEILTHYYIINHIAKHLVWIIRIVCHSCIASLTWGQRWTAILAGSGAWERVSAGGFIFNKILFLNLNLLPPKVGQREILKVDANRRAINTGRRLLHLSGRMT